MKIRFGPAAAALATLIGIPALAFHAEAAGAGNPPATIEIDGRTRSYFVHVPSTYDGKTPLPLVLVLHGATQSAAGAERMSGMSALADRENFLVAYPTGTSRFGRAPTWNAGNCCGYALKNNVNDITFIRALIQKLESDYSVDPKRIYVTGISNGAMMSFRVACELSDQVAAVASVEGAQNVACNPSSPVSIIMFHGTADRLVPFQGGTTPFQVGPQRSDTPVVNTVGFWVRKDGCSPSPHREEIEEALVEIYAVCNNGIGVSLFSINGGRHMWPGTRMSRNHVPATDIMWQFFAQHPKQ